MGLANVRAGTQMRGRACVGGAGAGGMGCALARAPVTQPSVLPPQLRVFPTQHAPVSFHFEQAATAAGHEGLQGIICLSF